ncbi:MAG: hypothetical protein WCK90_05060 [archaeon]
MIHLPRSSGKGVLARIKYAVAKMEYLPRPECYEASSLKDFVDSKGIIVPTAETMFFMFPNRILHAGSAAVIIKGRTYFEYEKGNPVLTNRPSQKYLMYNRKESRFEQDMRNSGRLEVSIVPSENRIPFSRIDDMDKRLLLETIDWNNYNPLAMFNVGIIYDVKTDKVHLKRFDLFNKDDTRGQGHILETPRGKVSEAMGTDLHPLVVEENPTELKTGK